MTQTVEDPRLATGGWLDLTRQAFHLLDYLCNCSFVNATLVISPFFTSHMISSIFSSDNCFSVLSCRILWAYESDGIACAYSIATSSSLCSFSLNAAISTAGQKEMISSSSFCNISGISFVSEI